MQRIAHIATHPPRFNGLLRRLQELPSQFDKVRVWVNNYSDELCRIHANGVTEIQRRGIPQWR